jgi:hypothetical protein
VDSVNPPDGRVVKRTNSPSDNQFAAFDSGLGSLSFSASILNPSFTAANSVVNGIPRNSQSIHRRRRCGHRRRSKVQYYLHDTFLCGRHRSRFLPSRGGPVEWKLLLAFGSEARRISGNGLPIPGRPSTDLQSWIRNDGAGVLAPDWERIGTDVTGQGPFNATFSLSGTVVPEPSSAVLLGVGLGALVWRRRADSQP